MRNDSVNIQCKHYQESKDHLGVKVTTTGNPDVAVQKKPQKTISINTETLLLLMWAQMLTVSDWNTDILKVLSCV